MIAGMEGRELLGGRVTRPKLVDGKVVRAPTRPNPVARAAMRWFQASGWDGAPRLLAVRPDGSEVLSYLPGRVPWVEPVPSWASTDIALAGVAHLVRQFHDLTAGTSLAADGEVLCRHDLAPNNTVYRDAVHGGQPYAFIDWDLAGPGRRIEDVAHVCWTWLDLGPRVTSLPRTSRQVRHIMTAYGADFDVHDVLQAVTWWQHRRWQGIEQRAAAGDPAMRTLISDGTAVAIRAAAAWTQEHIAELSQPG